MRISDWSADVCSSDLGDTRLRFSASVFRAKTKGIQVIATSVSTSSYQAANLACTATNPAPFIDGDCNLLNDPLQTVITINGGDVVNRGIEPEATIAPTHRLIFNGTATFLDSNTQKQTIPRPEERREGKEFVVQGKYRWTAGHKK